MTADTFDKPVRTLMAHERYRDLVARPGGRGAKCTGEVKVGVIRLRVLSLARLGPSLAREVQRIVLGAPRLSLDPRAP